MGSNQSDTVDNCLSSALIISDSYTTSDLFNPLFSALEQNKIQAFLLKPRQPSKSQTIHQYAEHLAQRIEDESRLLRSKPSLIGFGAGGIVARYFLQELQGLEQISRLITLATPHSGTRSRFSKPSSPYAELRTNSALLTKLNREILQLKAVNPVSLWTPWDLTVRPCRNAILPLGEVYRVPARLHSLMPRDPRAISIVLSKLTEDRTDQNSINSIKANCDSEAASVERISAQ